MSDSESVNSAWPFSQDNEDLSSLESVYSYVFDDDDVGCPIEANIRLKLSLHGFFELYSIRTYGFLRKVQAILESDHWLNYENAKNFFYYYLYRRTLCFEVCRKDNKTMVDLSFNFIKNNQHTLHRGKTNVANKYVVKRALKAKRNLINMFNN